MFDTLQDRLSKAFRSLRGKGRLSDKDIDVTLSEIRVALLEADVHHEVVKTFVDKVRTRAQEVELSQAINPAQQIVKIVHEQLVEILGGQTRNLQFAKNPPTVIMLAGLQGAGKTTLAGKLAWWLKDQGHSPLLVAADLQRPNAVNQLQIVGDQAKVAVFAPEPGNGKGNPVKVARKSMAYAKKSLHDVVIVDTAGRLGVDEEMLKQAADIRDAVSPDEILFVVDAMIGQDAVTTANSFAQKVGFDGVVLTKLDGDARGGAALSVATVTGAPIMFASVGEKLEDFEVFHPDRMAGRILDMGDVLTLIEQAERHFDEEQAAEAASKLFGGGGGFTLQDFLTQMQAVRKMGPISKLMGMLPGAGAMADQLSEIDDKSIDHIEAIIYSMTPAERADVSILNGSRRARIACGAGVEVSEVNNLVNRFEDARKMMQQLGGGMFGGMGGMGGFPGTGGGFPSQRKPKPTGKRKKSGSKVSGNPAKRAAAQAGEATAVPDPSEAFALPTNPEDIEAAMADFQLPPNLAKMFGN
ncbi:MAG: signal recognition particle protein [Propionibacteriaceae bacterium]|nr:signal recognition particle protein [Propionibacteriaceae bacterium]